MSMPLRCLLLGHKSYGSWVLALCFSLHSPHQQGAYLESCKSYLSKVEPEEGFVLLDGCLQVVLSSDDLHGQHSELILNAPCLLKPQFTSNQLVHSDS